MLKVIPILLLLFRLGNYDAAPQNWMYYDNYYQDVCLNFQTDPCPGQSQICINTDEQVDRYTCECADEYSYKWNRKQNECYCAFEEASSVCHFCKSRDVEKRLRHHWKKEILFCKEELKECRVTRDHSGSMPDEEYVNMNQAGNGYNLLLANPLEMGRRDKGHRNLQLFKPFSYAQDNTDDCIRQGYSSPHKGKSCHGIKVSKVYTSISDVETEMEHLFTTDKRLEEASMEIFESQNAQSSNAIAFGAQVQHSNDRSDSESANHCVDDVVAKSTSVGGSIEKNGQSSDLDSQSNTDLITYSSSTGSTSDKSDTSGSHGGGGGGIGIGVGIVNADIGGGGGRSNSNTNSNRKDKSNNDGNENSKASMKESSSAAGWSAVENNDKSSSRSITTNVCSNRDRDSSLSRTNSQTNSGSNGSENGQSKQKSYQIPGYLDSIQSIKQVKTLGRFLNDTKKMISYSTAKCTVWSMRMLPNIFPTFSEDFKIAIRKLHYANEKNKYRLKIKKIADEIFETTLDKVQETELDKAFSEFIANYGTHYFTYVEFGGGSVDEFRMTHSSFVKSDDKETKDCMDDILQDKLKDNLTSRSRSRNICRNPVLKDELSRRTQITEMNTYSEGSALLDRQDIVGYTQDGFDNPVPVKFELQPIITIFQSEMMTLKRISTDEGEPIDFKSIFSWFHPRYAILLGRCAALGNYRMAPNGASCIECPHHLVPSYDRTECVDPVTLMRLIDETCLTLDCIIDWFNDHVFQILQLAREYQIFVIGGLVLLCLLILLCCCCCCCCYCRRCCKSSRRRQEPRVNAETEMALIRQHSQIRDERPETK